MRDAPIYSRAVRLNTGEMRHVIDHDNNPESVIFSPGGVFDTQGAVIQGEVSKLSKLDAAENIFRALSKTIKKYFGSIRGCRVGPEARLLHNKGYRLTASIRSPVEYDLSFVDS